MEAEIFARMNSTEQYDSLLKLGFNFEGETSAQTGVDFVKSLYIESAFGEPYHTNISQDISEELSPAFFDTLIKPYMSALENKPVLSDLPSSYTVIIDFSDNDAGVIFTLMHPLMSLLTMQMEILKIMTVFFQQIQIPTSFPPVEFDFFGLIMPWGITMIQKALH